MTLPEPKVGQIWQCRLQDWRIRILTYNQTTKKVQVLASHPGGYQIGPYELKLQMRDAFWRGEVHDHNLDFRNLLYDPPSQT